MTTPDPVDELQRDEPRQSHDARQAPDQLRLLVRELDLRDKQLARSEARFRDVIQRNADAIFVVSRDGSVRFANRSAEQLFGRGAERLVGSLFGFPLVADETTEVDIVVAGKPRVAEMRVVRSEWEGTEAFIASLRDVTERNRAEQNARRLIREQAARTAAEESEARMRFLAESSSILSASLDYDATLKALAHLCIPRMADWTVVYGLGEDGRPRRVEVAHCEDSKASVATQLRDKPIETRGPHPVLEVLRSRRSRLVREVTDEMLASMTSTRAEFELARTLGITSYMLVPMIARERAIGAIAFVSAKTDRRFDSRDLALAEDVALRAALAADNALLYSEAKRANQTKADFLAVVSHDLRTPLTAIMGYADLLSMGIPEPMPAACAERVDRIRTSADHLQYLIKELLAFARLDAGRETAHPKEVDLRDVVHDVANVMEPIASERHLELYVQAPEAGANVVTDPDKVRQILLNLVGNAVRYTEKGTVSVTVDRAKDGGFEIQVRDTGPGIAATHLDRIFEPFWQLNPAQRTRGGGTGLGLSVVKHLAAILGGRIAVQSKVGEGSLFTLMLPARPQPHRAADSIRVTPGGDYTAG
jgi:signal transduction histidine kinase